MVDVGTKSPKPNFSIELGAPLTRRSHEKLQQGYKSALCRIGFYTLTNRAKGR